MKQLISIVTIALIVTACNSNAKKETEALKMQQVATIDSLNMVVAKQKIIDSMKAVKVAHVRSNAKVSGYDAASAETPATSTPVAKRKGWTGAEKGVLIGAGTGAIAGAIIDKKHGEGAIIGGLLGAGIGAGTGAIIDKNKRKKAAAAAAKPIQ